MSKQTFRKSLVAFATCSMVASSLMLASPANATDDIAVEPTELTTPPASISPSPAETEATPPTPTTPPTTPAATETSSTATKKKSTTRAAVNKSKYTPAPSLSRVRAGKAVLRRGMKGPAVKQLQLRLRAAGYLKGNVNKIYVRANGIYDKNTGRAVDRIREKNYLPEGTTATNRVVKSLWSMTKRGVPSICKRQKKALCISKKQMVMRYYKRGKLVRVFDARFGQVGKTPTREGNFRVHTKIANGKSDLSGTWMPWALYFSRSQAVHFSPGFRSVGYYGASLGCVNIRDYKDVKWLYRQIPRGTFVKVYK